MIRISLKQMISRLVTDRTVLTAVIIQFLLLIVYMVVVGLSIYSSDVKVYNRYSSFGEVHFYKDYWQYFLLFMAFGLVATLIHTGLVVKLQGLGRRQAATAVAYMGAFLLIVALLYGVSVLSLGRAT